MTPGHPLRDVAGRTKREHWLPTWIGCVLAGSAAALSGGDVRRFSTFAFIAATYRSVRSRSDTSTGTGRSI